MWFYSIETMYKKGKAFEKKIEFENWDFMAFDIARNSFLTYFSGCRDTGWKIDTWRKLRITHFTMNLVTRRFALHSRNRVAMRSPTEIFECCHTSSLRVPITSKVAWIKHHVWFSTDLCISKIIYFQRNRFINVEDNYIILKY